jgi:hypothetical protein
MFGRKTESVKEKAFRVSELALQLAQDRRFRKQLRSAAEHGKEAWHQTRGGPGLVEAARRLAVDPELQGELRRARVDLKNAYERLDAKRGGHRLRYFVPLAGLASLAAMPQIRERVSELIATASKKREHIQKLATTNGNGSSSGRRSRPRALDDLTKEELYARAQKAEIPGRSEMSKEELVTALRSRAGT